MKLVLSGCVTKKTHNQLTCVERGTRCPACRLPERPKCSRCGRTKPGRHVVLPSSNYREWERSAVIEAKAQQTQRAPIESLVHVQAVFYRPRATGDLVGYLQALADMLETAGIIANDRQITCWDGTRMDKDAKRPRVEVEITELAPEQGDLALEDEEDPMTLTAAECEFRGVPTRPIRQRILG